MKGLFFSSRSLSMSPPDQLVDERHKSKLKHHEENVKSSPRSKFKREKVKNSDFKTEYSSTFQRCKKLVSIKRFSVQDRLKRIRSNVLLQDKIIDQVCSETDVNTSDNSKNVDIDTNICGSNKNLKASQEPYLQRFNYAPLKVSTESMHKSKYSADSRLKKIKAAFQKKIMNKRPAELKTEKNVPDECHTEKIICPISSNEERCKQISSDGVLEFERTNLGKNSGMDVDQEYDCSRRGSDDCDNSQTAREENTVSTSLDNSYSTKTVCEYRNDRAYLALYESDPDVTMKPDVPHGDLFIVIDTNILLSHLSLVRKLLTSDIPPYKSPVVVIPWLVLQELDYAIKKNDPALVPRAKAANLFLHDYLKKKHPRLFGQTMEDFKRIFKNAVSIDDCILQYCLKFTSLEKHVILLTDDINFHNKSMVHNLNVFNEKEFERKFFS